MALGDNQTFAGSTKIVAIARGAYYQKTADDICSSGYAVDSLEAAMWCFVRSHSFAEAVLTAANLGDDADTTAAVCGQVAGAYYGVAGIPAAWLERLALRSEITHLTGSTTQAKAGYSLPRGVCTQNLSRRPEKEGTYRDIIKSRQITA